LFGWISTYASLIPVVGETFMRLRSYLIMSPILRGGVADANSTSPALKREMYRIGNRSGTIAPSSACCENAESWERAQQDYGRITVPVLLIWGGQGLVAAFRTRAHPLAHSQCRDGTVEGGGHFLPLDRPRELSELLIRFAGP